MFATIYMEEQVSEHPRAREIRKRFPQADCVVCRHFGEVFNPKAQDFRLQKQRPALILAHKHDRRVLPAPAGYGIGSSSNYYFSHMLNCLYDCRYCFLQGMYRSAHHVLFVNYEDFLGDIARRLEKAGREAVWFFSGYDCDSLALDPVSGFADAFLPFFAEHPLAHIELRTKSTQVRGLLRRKPLANAVIAFSFTPDEIHRSLEHRVPAIERRLDALVQLQEAGWPVGLRFDPLIYRDDFRHHYRRLFREVFTRIHGTRLHSVSLGAFRLPRGYFRNIVRLYPDEPLFAGSYTERGGMVSYPPVLEEELTGFCATELLQHIPASLLFTCEAAA
ncbi:MAG: radical SAM protein [Gammaproteobacteria bacterium]|jgi:spore photoproduct lyase